MSLYVFFLNSHSIVRNTNTITFAHTIPLQDVHKLQDIYFAHGIALRHSYITQEGKQKSKFTLEPAVTYRDALIELLSVYE